MRRPTPPAAPRWTPCPDEARGLACPTAGRGRTKRVAVSLCDACGMKRLVPVGCVVIELGARAVHWTCPCGAPHVTFYDEHVEQGHYMCALVRSGADVLRDDITARAAVAMLEAKIRRVRS